MAHDQAVVEKPYERHHRPDRYEVELDRIGLGVWQIIKKLVASSRVLAAIRKTTPFPSSRSQNCSTLRFR